MDALPPDPYLALGVAKDATTAVIKSQYRKLVLKCHPDKVEDSQKQDASDKFHKIQTAYEIIGDEERRSRYDAQCKLAELRKEAMERGGPGGARGGVEVRTASYKMPTESARGDFYARGPERYTRTSPQYDMPYEPQYEERRPSYAQEDYFDHQPRTASRKYDDYERASKRSPPKEERAKPKTSTRDTKENERSSRKEKSRRTEKDVRRDRDRKSANATIDEVESDESAGKKARRARAEEDDKLREQKAAAESYYEKVRRDKEAAESGAYTDERANKILRDSSQAYEYINRTRNTTEREPEERPPQHRAYSSKDKVEFIKREGRPTISVRRGSEKTARQDSRKSTRDREEVAIEPQERNRRGEGRDSRRPPTLAHTKSAPPAEVRPDYERPRSYSVQEDYFDQHIPQVKRSETMPSSPAVGPSRESRGRKQGSKLRPEESYATPERTPEPDAKASRYQYGNGQQYADDGERCTPDGYVVDPYRTEVREPSGKRYTRSPSPMEDRSRDRQRSSSNKQTAAAEQPPPLPRTTSHQYRYPSRDEPPSSRPQISRENSGRREDGRLYGEVRTTASPRQSGYAYSPPPEKVSTSRAYTGDDFKIQSGYSRRPEKPSFGRSASARVY